MNKAFIEKFGFVIIIYVVLVFGGVWHILGLFQKASQYLFVPLLVFLFSVNLVYYINRYRNTPMLNIFFLWTGIVFVTALAIEIAGEKTGIIFGHYRYTDLLSPKIFGVPIVIGLSWLNLVFGSVEITHRFFQTSWPIKAAAAALLMTGFDAVMEPAARALGFWYWQNYAIPVQNYIAWFAFAFIFTFPFIHYFPKVKTGVSIPMHIFIAQFIYFTLINFA
jgi:putative membrane protein